MYTIFFTLTSISSISLSQQIDSEKSDISEYDKQEKNPTCEIHELWNN